MPLARRSVVVRFLCSACSSLAMERTFLAVSSSTEAGGRSSRDLEVERCIATESFARGRVDGRECPVSCRWRAGADMDRRGLTHASRAGTKVPLNLLVRQSCAKTMRLLGQD